MKFGKGAAINFVALFFLALLQGCSSIPTKNLQNVYTVKETEIDVVNRKIIQTGNDGIKWQKRFYLGSTVHIKPTGDVEYPSIGFSKVPLIGTELVGITPYFFAGYRLAYLFDLGYHVGFTTFKTASISTGFDYSYDNIVIGGDFIQPIDQSQFVLGANLSLVF